MIFRLIRFFDILFSFIGLIITTPLLFVVWVIGYFDTGSPVFYQERVGRFQKPFMLIKFRTMSLDTASVATHLVNSSSVTKVGEFLRRTKIDELLQLINVLRGDMSLVGPRPCLYSQLELIEERNKRHVYQVLPGITGLAQINKIDMSIPKKLAEIDEEMIGMMSLKYYFIYIVSTVFGKGKGDNTRD